MSDLLKFFAHRFRDRTDRWHPFLGVYYLTYACDFRCPYCSDGAGVPYHRLPQGFPPSETAARIVERMRRHVDHLVITGGEPLLHPRFEEVMAHAGRCGFKTLALTTNGFLVDRHVETIARSVDTLVVSIDTLDEEKADRWHGRGGGTFRKILENLERMARLPGRDFEIALSSVVTPENIPDLYGVYEFSRRNGFTFAAAPQLEGVHPHPGLRGNEEYRRFFEYLRREKLRGGAIFGTPRYLRSLGGLGEFSCRPFTMLVASPEGEVSYPCLEIGHKAGSLLDEDDLHALRVRGAERFGPQPRCRGRCHSACALGFALFFSHPLSLIPEGISALGRLGRKLFTRDSKRGEACRNCGGFY